MESVSEADAGTYVCRVSNNRARVETRATLRVIGVVPKFTGDSWLALPTLRDAYMQFDIEVSFKPSGMLFIIFSYHYVFVIFQSFHPKVTWKKFLYAIRLSL